MSRFDQITDRKNTNSVKHDGNKKWGMPEELIPLWVADMDFRAPEEVSEAICQVAKHGIYGYSMVGEEYEKVVRNWFLEHFGFSSKAEKLVQTPGIVFAISNAVRAFTQPGDAILIQQPVYYPFVNCIVENNRTLVNNELVLNNGRYEMDLIDFEQKIRENQVKMFILCSPHNPVGRVWTKKELTAVAEICLKHNVFVIADEIHCDFTYPGHVHTVFASLFDDVEMNCMICTAPSKTFNLAGLQCSNLFIRDALRREQLERQIYLTGYEELNVMGLTACRAAYQYGAPWLSELKDYLYESLCMAREYINTHIPKIKLIEPEGTYLLWLDCSALGLTDEELEQFMIQKAGLWLDGGNMFGTKSGQFQRVNMASPKSVILQALQQLEKAVMRL